ncbi:non-heme iron oxygenase ferredoxin subunit [Ornithinicoccus hortensis]|uniref:3-phenylpropionate/trans-cinnamate dioxygenase ferredoxin subunit n=1 Tax=Ornithinicoccus hortensis TaxID=82346 RepID=A0A542YSN6_9MICO|nr:non-heme iron oxygenase ferredoxin subunit [Ornithinicoccus hortensis]TQL51115.1 3-phenylpropionate/trans-cinnamate dioxygenase ferredoxin subunit [Ornithinicoccus hortensis]
MSAQPEDRGFVRVCTLQDLPEVGAVRADFDGRMVTIARDSRGEVHAFDDTCTHENISLAEGEVDGTSIECWLHGSRFDMVSGRPTSLPATQPVVVHTVKIQGDDVYVAIND